jgi:hypothetical protein
MRCVGAFGFVGTCVGFIARSSARPLTRSVLVNGIHYRIDNQVSARRAGKAMHVERWITYAGFYHLLGVVGRREGSVEH